MTDLTINKNETKVCDICGVPFKKVIIGNNIIQFPNCDCGEKIQNIKEKAENRRVYKCRYKTAGFTKRYIGKRLKNITCENIDIAKNFTNNFKSHKSKGLFLIGKPGNGKTTLAICIGKELFAKNKRVLFLNYSEFLNRMQETYSFENENSISDLIKNWSTYDLLIIDDFGREKYTDKRLENTFLFFDKLYNECTNIIITANPENISKLKQYSEFNAIFDRLAEQTEKVIFKNNSFRRE